MSKIYHVIGNNLSSLLKGEKQISYTIVQGLKEKMQ